MTAEVVITQAKRSDAPAIAKLLEGWIEVSSIEWPPIEPNALIEWVLHVIDQGYVVMAKGDGRLLGVAGIMPGYVPWNMNVPIMRDSFFFVPKARSTSQHHAAQERVKNAARRVPPVANGLMDALKLYCAKRKKPLIMEVISGVNTDKLDRWYQIKGGKYAGGVYVYGFDEKG